MTVFKFDNASKRQRVEFQQRYLFDILTSVKRSDFFNVLKCNIMETTCEIILL